MGCPFNAHAPPAPNVRAGAQRLERYPFQHVHRGNISYKTKGVHARRGLKAIAVCGLLGSGLLVRPESLNWLPLLNGLCAVNEKCSFACIKV